MTPEQMTEVASKVASVIRFTTDDLVAAILWDAGVTEMELVSDKKLHKALQDIPFPFIVGATEKLHEWERSGGPSSKIPRP